MLQAFDASTGEPVNIGDEVTDFRGDKATLVKLDRAATLGRSGKVTVRRPDGTLGWHYDGVWGLVVWEVDPPAAIV